MIVTQNWLKEFVSFDFSPAELAHRLTMAGLEVEGQELLGEGLDSVVVARLLMVEQHPDAERLTLCKVDNGAETVQVVCGATNHRQGDLVALAKVGSVLPGDFKIKKSKIRGQVSEGMLCSEAELGLAETSGGIMILPEGLELGVPVFDALRLKDVRFEIGLTPNRPDCLSVFGVAREIGAMTGAPPRQPSVQIVQEGEPAKEQTSVTIEAPERCPRYAARLIRGVAIGPSPDWLVRRVEAVGMRSINNVVDVTNYVLMELGHPLHAFDFNLLRGKKIVVKQAADGELFTTLDGQERKLVADDLVICDGEGPVALAGIMGGENSEIQDSTTDVLLESAYFNPNTIRRTSKRLGIHSESSHRFERGADVDMVPTALDRAAELIQQTAGGKVCRGAIDCYPRPLEPREVVITAERTNRILGLQLTVEQIGDLLRSIGLTVSPPVQGSLTIVVPLSRPDLEREIDLIEEVARLNGYEKIPVTMPASQLACQLPTPSQEVEKLMRDALVGQGLAEVVNYSFVSPHGADRLGLAADDPRRCAVPILNPLTEDQSFMRTTLVPSMLETLGRNLAYRTLDLRLFELRPVFTTAEIAGPDGRTESKRLAVALTGNRSPLGWAEKEQRVDFYDLKGLAEFVLAKLGIGPLSWEPDAEESFFHPGKSARIHVGDTLLGALGEIHPAVLESFEIGQPVYLLDLDVAKVVELYRPEKQFSPLSRFPDVFRDSAILVEATLPADRVLAVIEQAKAGFAQDVVLFDLYTGQGVPEGKKSLAFRVRYRSTEKTFTDEEINRAHARIIKALNREVGAEIR